MRLSRCLWSQNSIKNHFLQKIKFNGPITVSEYMKTCLYQPQLGFYSRNPLGRHGHFITSPEISSLFGEMLGIWAARQWELMGCPVPLTYVELGPGRGLMCADAINAFCKVTDVKISQIQIKLVEISEALKRIQKERIGSVLKSPENLNIDWYNNIMNCDIKSPFFLFANEFFDAVPIHVFKKSTTRWLEVLVDVDDNDNFVFRHSPNITPSLSLVPEVFHGMSHLELSFESGIMLLDIAKKLNNMQGTALIVDYGHDDLNSSPDTFRAFRSHKQVNPLEDPGECDLTADVNFAYFKHLLNTDNEHSVDTYGLVDQGDFLMQLGIHQRLEDAMRTAPSAEKSQDILSAFKSITSPQHMGSKFKVFSMQTRQLPEPPGFVLDDSD